MQQASKEEYYVQFPSQELSLDIYSFSNKQFVKYLSVADFLPNCNLMTHSEVKKSVENVNVMLPFVKIFRAATIS